MSHKNAFRESHFTNNIFLRRINISSFSCANICYVFCTSFSVIFCVSLLLALPITELVMSGKYFDQIVCDSFLSLRIWLIVKASFSIALIAFFAISYFGMASQNKALNIMCFLTDLFIFAWIILGAIMFWHDCPNFEPKPVNTLMYCSLIIGFIYFLMALCILNKIKNEE